MSYEEWEANVPAAIKRASLEVLWISKGAFPLRFSVGGLSVVAEG